ncbi:hypothetical protein DICVIV_00091 [Dictyocaulus viviparus]|uniref:Uncharacterized protein n=1 Tax=Dictyocaulus viviparus TaxID=29172 RepID=A0A0D8Y9Y7_DICVI|nr:hypothetical protein DICVIV_00091 [Dictyocaulus viviparus]
MWKTRSVIDFEAVRFVDRSALCVASGYARIHSSAVYLIQIYLVTICRMQRDSRTENSNQLIQIYSSSPSIRAVSQQPFLLTDDIQQVAVQFSPDYSGRRIHFLNAVDVSSRRLVHTWIAYTKAERPTISKTFDIKVSNNEERIVAKKLPISNPYSIPRTFRVASSRSEVVEVGEEVLDISGFSSTTTTLYFHNVFQNPISLEIKGRCKRYSGGAIVIGMSESIHTSIFFMYGILEIVA